MPERIYGLELLRGFCAVLVAVYHGCVWSGLPYNPTWGLYGVYIFFGISGAVLYKNYHNLGPIGPFLLRRFARLMPLYVACTVVLAIAAQDFSAKHLLNAFMLFGFANPGQTSVVPGGWSLGIECVFYMLFPALLAFTKSTKAVVATFAALLMLRVIFAEAVLEGTTIQEAWNAYTQPGSFMAFFFGGMAVAKFDRYLMSKKLLAIPAIVCLAALFAMPATSYENVLTGTTGLMLSLLSVLVVACFYWSTTSKAFRAVCNFFGETSYGMYLIHPIAWGALTRLGVTGVAQIVLTIVASAVAAWVVYRIFERPARDLILRYTSFAPDKRARLI